ncbi:pseudaminic acid cytidylyltransferase [Pelagibacterales bacterium SAG-MED25]|uniref:pseudaminic acid cytidylyltransferase n=1 Tax=Pelagibacter sp. (strain HTCC7211) TaxID=439493 RepID=UPI00030A9979|nr:pseudaminic acid cytidylyltransferase [Candidatus Pelagibacter sp. HTCC7211]MBD1151155.1 pseudaminic acid cytidylyltransferase [Pelagibacterales bacterium SAG-MED25]
MNIAIIPARKNSQRIKNKNIKIFNGKPIIFWSIKTALKSKLFKDIFVSTDSKKIAQYAIKYGAKVLYPRPSKLSDAHTTIMDVIKFEIKNLENRKFKFNNVCCIFPATPFLRAKYLSEGLKFLKKSNLKGFIFAGNKLPRSNLRAFYFKQKKLNLIQADFKNTRTQDLPNTYIDAGQFYWGTKKLWKKESSVFIKNSNILLLPRTKSVDIDNNRDWKEAEIYAKKK